MLNTRHKIVAFITIVFTGIALLFEFTLTQGVGILMIGAAIAWVVGSDAMDRASRWVLRLPGRFLPIVRVSIAFLFASFVLVLIAIYSNFSETLVVAGMLFVGLLLSPLRSLPTAGTRLRIIPWFALMIVFFLGSLLLLGMDPTGRVNASRIGELEVPGIIALLLGMFWLVKGKNLILRGLQEVPGLPDEITPDTSVPDASSTPKKRSIGLYVLLSLGSLLLIAWVGLLVFDAFDQSILPVIRESQSQTVPTANFAQGWFTMLLAWWPYACWKRILEREGNTTFKSVFRHRRITAAVGIVFTVIISSAVVFGVQLGNDRKLRGEFAQQAQEFQKTAIQIGTIKSNNLKTTDDYIRAYTEIYSLEPKYDEALQRYVELWEQAQERNKGRGLVNIQKLYSGYKRLDYYPAYFDSLRELSDLTKRQVQAVKQMASLPDDHQADFWEMNVYPLLLEQDTLREKIIATEKRVLGQSQ